MQRALILIPAASIAAFLSLVTVAAFAFAAAPLQEPPQPGLLAHRQRRSEGEIAGIRRHQRGTLSSLGTNGVRICFQNPAG